MILIYGLDKQYKDKPYMEELLFTKAQTREQAKNVIKIIDAKSNHKYINYRIQEEANEITKPNFSKILNI